MTQNKSQWFWEYLVSPVSKYKFTHEDENLLYFSGSEYSTYSLANGKTPILIEAGIFEVNSIKNKDITTQNPSYGNTSILKNYIRRHVLPSLTHDSQVKNRYLKLIENFKGKEIKVLIIGAGQKSAYYKEIFGEKTVTSDVHLQYGVDLVFDAHNIPFQSETFDIVLAQQVLEHCIRPWQVAEEFERVVKKDGLIQIEVPFCFPYHSAPYDFFRYTYSGLRSLFRLCKVEELTVPEGPFSSIAISISTALTESSNNRYIRIFWLTFSRYLLWPIKYFDLFIGKKVKNKMSLPKGFTLTFKKNSVYQSDELLISQIRSEIEMEFIKKM
jgi:ubiquinone/menaquinone biosynthesis C-methylase UbiE